MTNRQLKASSEARLWLGQIIIPTVYMVALLGLIIQSDPDLKDTITERKEKIKKSIISKFKKK